MLFEYTHINGLILKNRFVRSATWTGLADDDGLCTEELTHRMAELAKGGVGLIITGHAYVDKRGKAGPRQLGIDRDDCISRLKTLTKTVHDLNSRIILQLSHAGIYSPPELSGSTPLAVSDVKGTVPYAVEPIAFDDMGKIVEAFGMAARRAREAGFDGIQIHVAHGYLLNQFLSPAYNQREDGFGGSIENRSRVLLAVLRRIQSIVGPDFPILAKLNSSDFIDNGLAMEESLLIARMLEDEGLHAMEISGGTRLSGEFKSSRANILSKADEAYFEAAARAFKKQLSIPIILVGGIRSYETANRLVKENSADLIAMSRPFICEPDLVNQWEKGLSNKAACISDNRCMGPGLNGDGIRCLLKKRG